MFRPSTLIVPMVGALFFELLALKDINKLFNWYIYWKVFLGAFVLAMTNAAGNIFNHIIDANDTDLYNPLKKHRPLVTGEIDPYFAMALGVYIFGFGIVITFTLFNILSGLLISIIMFFAFSYSFFPRFKKIFILGNLSIATPRGMLGILTAYSFFNVPNISVLTFSFVVGVFVFFVNTTKDISDYDADKQAGIRNFVTVFGPEKAIKFIIIPGLYIPFLIYGIAELINFVNNNFVFIGVIMSVVNHFILIRKNVINKENVLSWYLFYTEMGILIILFSIPLLI
ncbi:MAG: UbiA family prenyltransferase [Candidatus Methanomethylicia archaeon]